jgi:hypothetical protein
MLLGMEPELSEGSEALAAAACAAIHNDIERSPEKSHLRAGLGLEANDDTLWLGSHLNTSS